MSQESMRWAEFLETVPPGREVQIKQLFHKVQKVSRIDIEPPRLTAEDIKLHCDNEHCRGIRIFRVIASEPVAIYVDDTGIEDKFIMYRCSNCRNTTKTYAVRISDLDSKDYSGVVVKLGEYPSFGPHLPARVQRLIQSDLDLFRKGYRAEVQGLGIGAAAYYRRAVENQKNHLLGEIKKVAERLGSPSEIIEQLDRAIGEYQFTKAIENIKAALPAVLLINGHNPLILLHNALSEGLHAKSDDECLEMATSIRVVLTELSERISSALKDDAELKKAVANLSNRNNT